MDGRSDQGPLPSAPLPPPPPVVPTSPEPLVGPAPPAKVFWTLGRKIFLGVFLVVLVVLGAIVLLAFNSQRQQAAARERFAGVYVNRDGTKIVLQANGDYDLEGYEHEGIAGEWKLEEYRTIPLGAFEPTELFIPYSQEVGGAESQKGWLYRISPDGTTLTEEVERGIPSDDPLDRYVRTKDL